MAYTKAQLEAIKNTLLASNQPILASQHRSQIQSLIDEMYDGQSRGNILVGVQADTVHGASDTFLIFRSGQAYQIPLSLFSATTLQTLGDVFITDLQNGDSLVYNLANDRWENQNILEEFALFNLIDVELTDPANGDILIYNLTSEKWENSKLNHNDLENIQGGDGVNYYHLGDDDFDKFQGIINPINGDWLGGISSSSSIVWNSVTYGNELFVAVGNSGEVMTSVDGVTWNTPSIPVDGGSWHGITYGNGLFVAVGSFGANRVMTSLDGITWTPRNASVNIEWRSVVYGNGIFVAVSQTGTGTLRVMISPDGINWTTQNGSTADTSWKSVTFGNGVFVAVGASQIMSSTDGINWTDRTPTTKLWSSVVYGNGLFVAISQSGNNTSAYSSDGITWDTATTPFGFYKGITYGNGLYIAVGGGTGPSYIIASFDGVNWEVQTAFENNNWESITYGDNKFVAVSTNGSNRVMYSNYDKILNHSQLNLNDGTNPHQTTAEDTGAEPSFLKGSFVAGGNIEITGDLTDRLVGSGNITINASGGGVSLDSQTETTASRIDNLVLLATTSIVVIDGTSNEITGMNAGGISRKIVLINKTGDFLSVTNDSANSSVGNRFANSVSFPSNGATEWVYSDGFWYRIG